MKAFEESCIYSLGAAPEKVSRSAALWRRVHNPIMKLILPTCFVSAGFISIFILCFILCSVTGRKDIGF